jgi:hypothetical protein
VHLGRGADAATHADTAQSASARAVHVALSSEPAGAEVLEGVSSLGHTPLQLQWTGERGDPARSHTFTFRLAGYRDTQVTLAGATLEHLVRLSPEDASAGGPLAAGGTTGAAGSGGASAGGTGTTSATGGRTGGSTGTSTSARAGTSGGNTGGRGRRGPAPGPVPTGYRGLGHPGNHTW